MSSVVKVGRKPEHVPTNGMLGTMATEDKKNYGRLVDVPASATASGRKGDYAVESGCVYFCVAADTWERVAVASDIAAVLTPEIISPLDGATGVLLTPTIQFSPYYSLYGKPQQALQVQIATDDQFTTPIVDVTLGAVSEYTPSSNLDTITQHYSRGRYQDDDGVWSAWTPVIGFTTSASFNPMPGIESGPGPTTGTYDATTDTGYYGLVASADLVDGPTLATDIGLSAGVAFNDTAGWLKFYVGPAADCNKDGVAKVLFIAKESIRNNLTWDDIYLAGAVYGTGDNGTASASTGTTATQDAQVIYGTTTYKVRLLTGSATDPAAEAYNNQSCADDAGGGSEWNDLLYRVHTAVPTCTDATIGMDGGSGTTRHGGPQDGANWASYTNAELQVFYTDAGDGTYCCCQEQGFDTTRRVTRGYFGVAYFISDPADNAAAYTGWRPCLEVIQS